MNLGYMLTKSAKQWPDRIAVAYGDQELTYRQLNDRINALANAFKGLGVREGDRVAIWQHNCPQLLETVFACFKIEAIVVPLNARFIGEEAVYHINDSESSVVVFEENFKNTIQENRQEIRSVEHYVCLSNPYEGMLDYARAHAARWLVYHAAWLIEKGEKARTEVAGAKLFAVDMAMQVASKALSVLGGYGVVSEFNMERHLRDVTSFIAAGGTPEINRLIVGRTLLTTMR